MIGINVYLWLKATVYKSILMFSATIFIVKFGLPNYFILSSFPSLSEDVVLPAELLLARLDSRMVMI